MIIKVCGMRSSANIQEVAKLKPDILGFIFYPKSKRFVGENLNPEIVKSLMPEIQTAGVFVNEEYDDMITTARKFDLDFLQLHGNESPEYCHNANDDGFDIIKAFGIQKGFDWSAMEPYLEYCKYLLFDTSTKGYGGSGQKFDWDLLLNYRYKKPFILSGGIDISDVNAIKSINHPCFEGIDVNSCFENEPGLKDVKKLELFFNRMRK